MPGSYYQNSKVNDVDLMEAEDLEAIESAFQNVDNDKANKSIPATPNNVALLNSQGDLADSGKGLPGGAIIGDSDAQALSNKTIDLTVNTLQATLALLNAAVSDATLLSTSNTETVSNKTINLSNNTLQTTLALLNAAVSDATLLSTSNSVGVTNKTINLSNNTLQATLAQLNAAISDATLLSTSNSATVTNKTINLLNNSLVTTLAQLNAAVSDANLASQAGAETLSNKTLSSPTLSGTVGGNVTHSGDNAYSGESNFSGNVRHGVTAVSTSIDCSSSNVFTKTITGTTTFTFNSAPSGFYMMVLLLTNGGAYTVNVPGSVTWIKGEAPSMPATGLSPLIFFTTNSGTNWYGLHAKG